MGIPINEITAEAFADLGGQALALLREDGPPLPLRLCAVRTHVVLGPRAAPPFSAILSAPDGARLGQGMYTLRHPGLGDLALFLVPVGPQADGPGYEVVFN
ncbi:DUF6916 family protein [Pseudomarimonas salicorniae]|uniref:DUF6916 domain-containing protein n=1 Tax=Pseudomarimonas salicorniae TaxID=2933270 RepID=A0ABT0GKA5_9GAMM|nr:hypothetical protein [Lysobacter sp. CAU 1642]MCK7594966.1 hypothetical protein [Lysobacter sp. CAU 1642]